MLEQNLQSSAPSSTQSCVLKQSSPASVSEKDTHYPKQALPMRGAGCTCQRGAPNLFLFSLGHVSMLSPPLLSLVSTPILASAPQIPISCFQASSFPFSFSFIVVQPLSCVGLFVTPWTAACQDSLSFTISWSLLEFMSIELVMLFPGCSRKWWLPTPFWVLPQSEVSTKQTFFLLTNTDGLTSTQFG